MLALVACLLFVSGPAGAGHERGADARASIDTDGVVILTVQTRWRKAWPAPYSGVDANRFGMSVITETGCSPITVDPPVGMRIIRASDESTVYSYPLDAFDLEATTVATDTSDPFFDERTQELIIPLGSVSDPAQINPPLDLDFGLYYIEWNDYNRIPGIRNLPSEDCIQNGFGFRVRVNYDGQARSGPAFDPDISRVVVRGVEYSHILTVSDPDDDPLTFRLAVGQGSPAYGPSTLVPGITLDDLTGELQIPSSMTSTLLDNAHLEPAGDYLLSVEMLDITGMTSVRHVLLDAVTTTNSPPTTPVIVGDPSLEMGESLALSMSATDPDEGDTVTLSAKNLEPWMVFTPTAGNPATATLTGTPTPSGDQPGIFTVYFTALDDGAPMLEGGTAIKVKLTGDNLPPTIGLIPNKEIAADPVTGSDQLNAGAKLTITVATTDPNPHNNLTLDAFFDTVGNLPPGASFVQTGPGVGVFEWTPDPTVEGVWGPGGVGPSLSVLATDDQPLFPPGVTHVLVCISVGPGHNVGPNLTLYESGTSDRLVQPVLAAENNTVRFDLEARDPNRDDRVRIGHSALTPLPAGASLTQIEGLELHNPARYEFSWTPGLGDAGEYRFEFKTKDDGNPPITERQSVDIVIAPYLGTPRILSVAPSAIPPPPDTPVTLKGVNLDETTMVEVGSTSVDFTIEDEHTIIFMTPGGSVDQLESVTVTTPKGSHTLSNALLYTTDPDSDRDGMQDCVESWFPDADSDGRPNLDDLDSDDDGIPDGAESVGPYGGPVIPVTCNSQVFEVADTDSNGVPDYLDLDADGDGVPDATEGENDIDLPAPDGIPNYRDTDCDGDSFPDATDNCVTTYQTDQADMDVDGVGDVCDNCPELFNASQEAVVFAEQIEPVDENTFAWPSPADVDLVRGYLSGVSVYSHEPPTPLTMATSFTDTETPPTGDGFYYVLKPGGSCTVGSWQTVLGAEPARDAALP